MGQADKQQAQPLRENGAESGNRPTPFLCGAREWWQAGCAVVPCVPRADKLSGKAPISAWKQYQTRQPTPDELAKWETKHPDANVGIITGPVSGITAIDVDQRDRLTDVLQACGETPLIVASARGYHAYYRHSGERESKILGVGEVKAKGVLITPPSYNRETGQPYGFKLGGVSDLARLPIINQKGLQELGGDYGRIENFSTPSKVSKHVTTGGIIFEGARTDALFKYLLRQAAYPNHSDRDLSRLASVFNSDFCSPKLTEAEVGATVAGVITIRREGKLVVSEPYVTMKASDVEEIALPHPRAFALLAKLRQSHTHVGKVFCIEQEETAKVMQCSPNTLRGDIQVLLEKRRLIMLERGGGSSRKPHRYRLAGEGWEPPVLKI